MRSPLNQLLRMSVLAASITQSVCTFAQTAPIVTFQGKVVKFRPAERPYFNGKTPMICLRPLSEAIGARAQRSRDGRIWTVVRGTDRLLFQLGETWFDFNGARQSISLPPEGHGNFVFVPLELIQSISSGLLEVTDDQFADGATSIYFGDRMLRYKLEDAPFRKGRTVFVAGYMTSTFLGAKFQLSRDGLHLTLSRSRDKLTYDPGTRWFIFNRAQRVLHSESVFRGKTLFLPLEVFQALVGDQIQAR